jgi:hypothetical protein
MDMISKKSIMNRLLCVRMTLDNVLYISYAVPATELRKLVPEPLQLVTVGKDLAFISVVILRSTKVRLRLLPFLHFNYNQLNIRTYVIDPVTGQHAVYFLFSGVTSSFISIATRMLGIPWQFIDLGIDVNSFEKPDSYLASGNWLGHYYIKSQRLLVDSKEPPFFENRKAAVDFLIRPLIGFIGDNRRLGRFNIQHPDTEPQSWHLTELDFPLFMDLCMIDDLKNPHSVFFLPTADFSIYLPPKTIKRIGGEK